jgi:hypothetical protein
VHKNGIQSLGSTLFDIHQLFQSIGILLEKHMAVHRGIPKDFRSHLVWMAGRNSWRSCKSRTSNFRARILWYNSLPETESHCNRNFDLLQLLSYFAIGWNTYLLITDPLLICTWFWKIKFDELDFLSISNWIFTACVARQSPVKWNLMLKPSYFIKDIYIFLLKIAWCLLMA